LPQDVFFLQQEFLSDCKKKVIVSRNLNKMPKQETKMLCHYIKKTFSWQQKTFLQV